MILRLPPGPELDPDSAGDAPHHDVEETALAAKNLSLPAHVGFQEQVAILNFGGDGNHSGGQVVASVVCRGGALLPGGACR